MPISQKQKQIMAFPYTNFDCIICMVLLGIPQVKSGNVSNKQLHADFYVVMEAHYESKRKTVKP